MRWQDVEVLADVGLTLYERKALVALMTQGVADADTLCQHGDVPSSKIYRAMEKLAQMGLVEIQPTRPKLYSAMPADEVVVVRSGPHRRTPSLGGARPSGDVHAGLGQPEPGLAP